MQHLLFLFLDGVGLGPAVSNNPLASHDGPAFKKLSAGQKWLSSLRPHTETTHVVRSLDSQLGVDGLPQSGTGQATLFTGTNCAQLVGRHFGPFPHSKTHDVLTERNLFRQVQNAATHRDDAAAFANAFPPQFFSATHRRSTVTTFCCQAANVPLRDMNALRNERAIAADLTGGSWHDKLQLNVPITTPAEAGTVLNTIAREHSLTLFEYFQTDKVGHDRVDTSPKSLLMTLEQFLSAILTDMTPERDTLVLTSDHGNFEDQSHTRHTTNRVPLFVYGWAAPFFEDATDLTDVTPGIAKALSSYLGTDR